jgi:acetyltransferase
MAKCKRTEVFIVQSIRQFGHLVLQVRRIFIEVLHDVNTSISPVSSQEADRMIKNLKSFKIIEGVRGQEGVNQEVFASQIRKISALVEIAPEIFEMDLNPLLGNMKYVKAVDARIRIEK